MSLTHDEIEKLLRNVVVPFHDVKRYMRLPGGERRIENDAEHSWSVTLLACVLATKIDPSLDVGKIAQLATVHDLVEVYADDTSVFGDVAELETKHEREALAFERLSAEFSHLPWLVATIRDYEEKSMPEALFVYAVDKYITVMYDWVDGGRYLREEKITQEHYEKKMAPHREKAQAHPTVGAYYDEVRQLLAEKDEYFYHHES